LIRGLSPHTLWEIEMNKLLGKSVLYSISQFDAQTRSMMPALYVGTIDEVSGSMIHIVKGRHFGDRVPDTWHNTASNLFNWVQAD
jgi:hypothetical protein